MPLIKASNPASVAAADRTSVAKGLASASADERWAAARAAGDVADAAAALAHALTVEDDAHVREAMFTSLARLGTAEAVDAILASLRSDRASLRTGALDALRLTRSLNVLLPVLLRDPDVDVRTLSCELARALPAPDASRMLCDLLAREPVANVCGAAIDVLAEVGGPDALPTLTACAQRFNGTPFLVFAVNQVADRIRAAN